MREDSTRFTESALSLVQVRKSIGYQSSSPSGRLHLFLGELL